MRRALAGLVALGVLLGLQLSLTAAVSSSACPSPTPSSTPTPAASGARLESPAPCPTPDPQQALYDQLRSQLGGDLARALTAQQRLSLALDQTAANAEVLNTQITQQEAKIADLEDKIAELDGEISDTQARIDVERAEVAALARAIYRQPKSLLELVTRAGSLRDALVATSDLVISGQRAHAVQARLEADLARLETERKARQADLDRESSVRDALVASLGALENLMSRQDDLSGQLDDLLSRIRTLQSGLTGQPPAVTAALARLLEQEERDLIQRSYQAAWTQAHVGSGLALVTGTLPAGRSLSGFLLSWPLASAQVTQPFGPSDVVLEPALGPFLHFHTGIDLSAPLGSPVLAAADGVVVAVNHTQVGYGNYVVIAHGGGIMTLYAHLLETDVNLGDRVMRGQLIGLEGSSGLSTGPHVHFELRVNDHVVDPMLYLPATAALAS